MARIVGYIATSLDGYIADSDGSLDWLTPKYDELLGEDNRRRYAAFMSRIGTTVMGRATYDWVAAHGMASPYPDKRTIVVTSTPLLRAPAEIETWQQGIDPLIARLRALFVRGEVAMREVNPNECIREVLALEHSDLIRRGVSTEVRLAPGIPAIFADRVQLQQVLLNLVVNACDAMAGNDSGERRLRITTAANGDGKIYVAIEDNGHGIADPDTIFEPFFSTKAHGIGLGLAICRTIVAAHGGALWASSNPTRGATFHLSIPAACAGSSGVSGH